MRFLLFSIPVIIMLSGITTCYMQPVGYDANPSVYSPAGLSFEDRDITVDSIDGDLVIQPAQGEDMIYEYRVYRGTASSREATEIDNLPVTGSPITVNVTQNIAGFTHLVVCGVGSDGIYGDCRRLDVDDLVVELFPGGAFDNIPHGFWEMGGYLYMSAEDGMIINGLYRTNGTAPISNVGSLRNINYSMVALDGILYFIGDGAAGLEVSWYDGSTEGQFDVTPGAADSYVSVLEVLNNHLFFCDNNTGVLYYIDDAMTHQAVPFVSPAQNPDNSEMVPYNGYLYMDCKTTDGLELCRANETGVSRIADINAGAGNSDPDNFIVFNNKVFFTADDGTLGDELYYTTGSGVTLVKDIQVGAGSSSPDNMTIFNNRLYFRADDGITGKELWSTDGTTAGTVLVKDINPVGNSFPVSMTVVGKKLYFSAITAAEGRELWISDGTTAGTYMLKNINPGAADSGPGMFHTFRGKIFFRADDGVNGKELWITDGTAANTYMVGDIDPGASGMWPGSPTVFKDKVYYSTDIGSGEVWVLYYK